MKVFASGLSVVLACIVPQAVIAQTTPNSPSSSNKVIRYPPNARVKPGAYIVELEGEPSRTNFGSMESRLRGLSQVTVDKQFKSIFNGFSVKTRKDFDPAKLASIPGVKTVWPVAYRTLPVQPATQNLTYPYLHQMTGVAKVNQELGFTGKGIKIGIIDSGVDYNHPELGACWKTPGCLWQNGADLIGDHYDPSNPNPTAAPDPDPMDCDGHGTHVAGIIGAQGPTVYGVAPGATLGMYRVFSCPANGDVSSSDDIILAGIEAAYKDGNDILSLSLGGGGWPEDPLSVVCSKLTKKGVAVVVANGNEGSAGLYTSGSPGLGRGVINVGSVDNWNNTGSEATVTRFDGKRSILISTPANQLIPFVFDSSVPIAAPTDSTGSALGCNRFNASLAGKIALISRGNCTFTEKSVNAQDAGAIGESDKWYYGGFLNFTLQWDGENVKTNYVVPYAGFNGNYRELDVLSAPGEGLPSITDSQGNPVEDLSRYRVSSNKTLTLNYRLEVPSRAVKVTLVDSMNKTLGYLPYGYSEYVVRNQQSESFFTYPALINGTVFADSRSQDSVKVPAGQYHARVSALRPLGRIDVDSDYQTWDSPAFSIT
ncbi:hypothetical protein GGI12_002916 [Dipsacomyces acuminosporus]|nr:hypothetical protein GGI12_002916 [Dipsacomyces acuminosporus]